MTKPPTIGIYAEDGMGWAERVEMAEEDLLQAVFEWDCTVRNWDTR